MKMTRRQFLKTIAAAAAAPAIVKAENIMPIQVPPEPKIVTSVDVFESEFGIYKPWQINNPNGETALFQPSAGIEEIDQYNGIIGTVERDELSDIIYNISPMEPPQALAINAYPTFTTAPGSTVDLGRIKRKPLGPARTPEEAEEMLKRVLVRFDD